MNEDDPRHAEASRSALGLLRRILWMMAGPAALALLGISLASNGGGWFAPKSIAFLIVLAVVMAARWGDPRTADGEPTTSRHLQRYMGGAVAIGLAAWLGANLIGNHGLLPEHLSP